jgi:hypothetical protein
MVLSSRLLANLKFNVTFDQLTLEIPLSRFICRTEMLKSLPYRTSIWLLEHGFTITHYFGTSPSPRATFHCFSCKYRVTRWPGRSHYSPTFADSFAPSCQTRNGLILPQIGHIRITVRKRTLRGGWSYSVHPTACGGLN